MKYKKRVSCVFIGVLLCLGLIASASAVLADDEWMLFDHGKCYSAKDNLNVRKTIVGITELMLNEPLLQAIEDKIPEFSTEYCEVRQAQQFCTAANKEVLLLGPNVEDHIDWGIDPFPTVPFNGIYDVLAGGYICYDVQCRKKHIPEEAKGDEPYMPGREGEFEVWDQFGKHTIELIKTAQLCTPVIPINRCDIYVGKDNEGPTAQNGDEYYGCRDIEDPIVCESAYQQDGYGSDVSCFWGENVRGETGCFGCGRNNQAGGACTNYCGYQVACANPDLEFTFADPFRGKDEDDGWGCRSIKRKNKCNKSFQISPPTGEPVSCFWGENINGEKGCFGCGPNNEDYGYCDNTCWDDGPR